MDSISTFLKENFDLVMLLVGVLGVVVSVIAVIYELKKKSKNKNK